MKTKFNVFLTLILALIVQISFAQEKVITGVVTEAGTGEPLPGVNVVVKGTDTGTATDFDGRYSIKAEKGQTLVFSFIGYETVERKVGDSNTLNVQLKEGGEKLDDVIVSAVAGATSKKKLSVSVVSVKSKDLKKTPSLSAASALEGKVAGVSITNLGKPGSGAAIILRGAANLYGSQAPLIIVDGAIIEGGISDINVDDIETMEVVKGASAASFYGSKAGNGVIVIKTKRGKKGKTEINVRSETSFSNVTNFVETNQSHPYILASDWESYKGQYTKYEGVTYPSTYRGVWAASGPDAVISGQPIAEDNHYADNPYGVYNDHQSEIFKTGINQTIYTSVASGTDKSKMFFSAEKTDIDGIFNEADGYQRSSIRANIDVDLFDWLKLSTTNNFIIVDDHSPVGNDGFYRSISRLSPDAQLLYDNPDGQPYYFKPDPWDPEVDNPLYELYIRDSSIKDNRFIGSYNLNVIFNEWVNMDLIYSMENDSYNYLRNYPYYQYEDGGYDLGFGYSQGSLYSKNYLNISQKAQASLNFKKSFGELDFTGKLSYLLENYDYSEIITEGQNYLYQDIISFDNFKPENIQASSDKSTERAQDYFAIAGFVYKDRYIFDALYRKDGSSLFGENYRWNDYYRVSGAYRISEDIKIPGVQELKIHAAQGTAGQRPSYDWRYERIPLTEGSLSTDRIKGNPDLRPSNTKETEVGIDASFLERFDLNFTYSHQNVTDQFMLVDLFAPANNGFNKQWVNVGDLTSDTYEFTLNSKIIKKNNLKWNVGINFTKSKATIDKLYANNQLVGPSGGEMFMIKEGVDFGTMYGRQFVTSLEQMQAQLPIGEDINDYSINSDGLVVKTADIGTVDEKAIILVDENGVPVVDAIGNQNPDFRIGITSNFNYKNFGFYMLWDWKQGGDVYNRNNQWNTINLRSAIVDQAGKPDDEKKAYDYYQSLYDVNQTNAYWVEDGTFVKLRELSLSYQFGDKMLNSIAKGFFKQIKISIIGRNLLTFTDYTGWDPEVVSYDYDTKQYFAVDYGVYPNQRSYGMSFELKF